jgi:hypothetical protein
MGISSKLTALFLLLSPRIVVAGDSICCEIEWKTHPVLCHLVSYAESNPNVMASVLTSHAKEHGLLVDVVESDPTLYSKTYTRGRNLRSDKLPVVFAVSG